MIEIEIAIINDIEGGYIGLDIEESSEDYTERL